MMYKFAIFFNRFPHFPQMKRPVDKSPPEEMSAKKAKDDELKNESAFLLEDNRRLKKENDELLELAKMYENKYFKLKYWTGSSRGSIIYF